MTLATPIRKMSPWDAKIKALRMWGTKADAWVGASCELHFVIGNRHPSMVTDLSIPFGVGETFEAAFDDAERRGYERT
jgi:hypothetical protein